MKTHTQVVVIGGGVVGCSVLYHLTKLGWKDVVLVERSELTSGSTWHAAGGFHTLNGDPNVAKLQSYTIDLYKEIEEKSGQSCGLHLTGGVMLAGTRERMDFLRLAQAKGRYLGMDDLQLITADEAAAIFPLMDKKHFEGALYDPIEGHLDPSGTTHAYAKAAKVNGAEIYLRNKVEELVQRPDGSWDVITEKGTIHAEHVVNAGGLWAREVGRMVGIELPVLAMEHMYLLTEDMPEVAAINKDTGKEVPHCIDFEGELYLRQERGGMLMGTYERAGVPWSEKTTPWDFGHELLQPDIDRIAPSLEVGFKHFPAFAQAGIKQIINGPFTFAPDGNPLVGPVRGLQNYWSACGVMAGFSQGGGVGLALANWMINGDPGFDVWGMDVARYGDWTTMAYTNAKVRENYSRRFRIAFPNETLPAGRPLRMTSIYDRLKEKGAVFADSCGIESAMWFAPDGTEAVEQVSFHRSNAFDAVAAECRAVREKVGLFEISGFAKYEVTGLEAEGWLNHMLANTMPAIGRMVLAPMLNREGKLIGDFTVAKVAQGHFLIFGTGVAEDYHMRWFEEHLPETGVQIRCLGLDLVGLSLSGPKSRDLMTTVAGGDVSAEAFKFMDFAKMDVGMIPAYVGRVSFTGDLGFEIWVKADYLTALYDLLTAKGEDFGLTLFGSRALRSLSLEKAFGSWATEYRPIYGPYEAAMGRFVNLNKGDFIGRDAAVREKEEGPTRKLVLMDVAATDADVLGDEPIWHRGEVIGWVTSGGYAHYLKKSLALGYVPTALSGEYGAGEFSIEILGRECSATILPEAPFDPKGERMRG
ncbi:GcvT family protein [Aestuariispira insulae]|uniref:Dimethylglycine dehydrogenase n=1 Tax=Aestuariispira insulae TaxID=1461337 RepID=A0A3D9HMT8_9PROT|nr:FAD-dependent oxidoreductase [Aestuariispira insulae]RED50779.1 dimethylglycine dehydrogenase [Aestuariispira insulae]